MLTSPLTPLLRTLAHQHEVRGITWQVYEGAPGRRAAVGDGEGHGVDLGRQVWDVQGQVSVSV